MKDTTLSERDGAKRTKEIVDQYGVNLKVTLEMFTSFFILQK